ncbi:MAG TPA: hypothetical protein VD883_02115 [Candidatus Omnitrophota bacterium]|nr:hypothetical protein [Candidatus Omnitrophota bacterium]
MNPIPKADPASLPTALVSAHPPHLMQVYGWIEKLKPRVYVLTDASGRDGMSKLGPTDLFLESVQAPRGAIYGRFTDVNIYSKLLSHDTAFFVGLADELARDLVGHGIRRVLGDAAEGFNPIHDVCRMITGAALEKIRRQNGLEIASFDFSLEKDPFDCPEELRADAMWLTLSDDEVRRKISFNRHHYPEIFTIEARSLSPDRHRIECLRPCTNRTGFDGPPEDPPFYERRGEERAATGRYKDVIRYREHVRPVGEALWSFACKKTAVTA